MYLYCYVYVLLLYVHVFLLLCKYVLTTAEYIYIYIYSALKAGLGSGTLHPGKVLGGSLPLLSPAFRRSHFSRQVPPSATTREILAARIPTSTIFFTCRMYRRLYFPSEGRRAEDFLAPKNPTASAGFEPGNLGTKGQHATPRPPKPIYTYIDN